MNSKTNNQSNQFTNVVDFLKEGKPNLRNPFDAVAICLHFAMKKMGFKCLGCGDSNDPSRNVILFDASSSHFDYVEDNNLLPNGWNSSLDSYSFRYKHPQSSMTFLIKCITLGDKLLIHGLALEDNHTRSLELE